tara:strand:+ start:323 stop:598 length:276 start_codon:yes stop_codon:yes gene_type:complete
MSGIVYENLPYPKGFYKDGRESKWYIDRNTQRVYRKVKIGESTRYVEQVSDIPTFLFGDISREHQEYLLRDRKKKSRNLDDLSAFYHGIDE